MLIRYTIYQLVSAEFKSIYDHDDNTYEHTILQYVDESLTEESAQVKLMNLTQRSSGKTFTIIKEYRS